MTSIHDNLASAAASSSSAADLDKYDDPSSPADALHLILYHLLPLLLTDAESARYLVGRWRLLISKLSLLRSHLSDAASAPSSHSNPLFLHLIHSILPTLRSLRSIAARCQGPDLPAGKLLLQSDLDLSASALDLHLQDFTVLLRSGLLHRPNPRSDADANALVLPLPGPSSSRADLVLFVRDLFARLQIGGLELKGEALDSLLDLLGSSDAPKLARLVAEEGDLPLLIRFIDSSSAAAYSLLRERVAAAVSILATASDASRRAVFEEGALGPLLRLLDAGSVLVKERAAAAIHAITVDSSSAWAVAAYGGVPILVAACRSGSGSSAAVQALAAGSLKNIVATDDTRAAMVEDGAVPAFVDLLLSADLDAQKNAALCLASLAAMGGNEIRDAIFQEGGVQRLLKLLQEASHSDVIDQALRAVHALAALPIAARSLSSSPPFFVQLADLIRRGGSGGNASIQETAASLVSVLSPSEDTKRSMSGSMAALIRMMEASKPTSAQEAAAGALVVLLSAKSNRKELSRDEKSITRLVQMLDPRNDVDKKSVVAVVLALTSGGGGRARKRLVETEACQHLQKLAEANVAGSKKAIQRIAGGRIMNIFSLGGWTQWS